ncbi:siderophore ABC transporter substrate-binding protein [Reinekea thalattae]|uniref:ABC transporter substrate-binding protein n=1 Tax=Reinekea thalattae TaxID=2593301 RepID=A0A5C8ZA20_9GAMM|nr:ABC transporter substrate-binding protein [Reinekea thalattae]TXR53660.1 ABC transporter substrate-binding protein [Reinekea thalattae]
MSTEQFMRQKLYLIVVSVMVVLISACSDETEVAKQTENNKDPVVVSLSLASLDTLQALEIPVHGLVKRYALNYLSSYQTEQYQDVGTFFEPNIEAIAALEPDLIIIGPRSANHKQQLSKISTVLDASVWGGDFLTQFHQSSLQIADHFNKRPEAQDILDRIDGKISTLRQLASQQGNGLLVVVRGGQLYKFDQSSRFGWFYDELGIPSAIDDSKGTEHGELISFEWLVQVNPDWLFVLDRDAGIGLPVGNAVSLFDNELVDQLSATKNNQLVYLDGYVWGTVGYGLSAVERSVDQLLQLYSAHQ